MNNCVDLGSIYTSLYKGYSNCKGALDAESYANIMCEYLIPQSESLLEPVESSVLAMVEICQSGKGKLLQQKVKNLKDPDNLLALDFSKRLFGYLSVRQWAVRLEEAENVHNATDEKSCIEKMGAELDEYAQNLTTLKPSFYTTQITKNVKFGQQFTDQVLGDLSLYLAGIAFFAKDNDLYEAAKSVVFYRDNPHLTWVTLWGRLVKKDDGNFTFYQKGAEALTIPSEILPIFEKATKVPSVTEFSAWFQTKYPGAPLSVEDLFNMGVLNIFSGLALYSGSCMVTFGFREKYEISKRGGSVIVKGKKSGVSTVEISPWCWEVVECAGKQKHVSLWQACVMVAEKTAFDPNDLLNMVAKDIRAVIGSGIVYADVV